MSTKLLLSISALILGLPGVFLLFAPDIALASLGGISDPTALLLVQIAGGLAVALGMNNWMARGTVMGGIYGRPLLVANLCAFFTAGLSMAKAPEPLVGQPVVVALAIVLLLCGLAFGRLLFVHPGGKH